VTFSANPALSICWAIMTVGEGYLAYLCLRTIRDRYPAFALYITYLTAKSVALMFVANHMDPWAYYYAYYTAGYIATGLQVSVVIEVFATLFKPYRYIPRRILTLLAISVPVTIAIITAGQLMLWKRGAHSVLGDYRIAELVGTYAVLVLFGGLFCFSSYFDMQWRSRLAGITIGMFIDSLSSVLTSSLVAYLDPASTEKLAFLPVLSFCLCEVIWIRYIRRPERLRAVVGHGERREIQALLNTFHACLEKAPAECASKGGEPE
jgi:hypothetical protein